jgi:hypothetical protein
MVHPLVDDKGALPTKVVLRAFFIDNADTYSKKSTLHQYRESYIQERDKFLELVNSPNPYMLQLPTYGAFPAVAGVVNMEFDSKRMGIEYVDVEFYRYTKKITSPSTKGDKMKLNTNYIATREQTALTVARMKDSLADRLKHQNGLPHKTAEIMKKRVLDSLNAVADKISALSTGIVESTNDMMATVDKYNRAVVNIANDIDTLILAPARLAQHIRDTYTTFVGAITSPIESFNYMKNSLDIFIDDIKDVTLDGLDALGLYDVASKAEHIGHTFSVMSKASIDTQYTSSTDVLKDREIITERYTSICVILARFPDLADLQASINSLYGSLMDYLIEQQANLPNTRTITVADNTPLLVTTYDMYGDTELEDALAYRNKVESRLSPPRELEVLVV